MIAVLKNKIRVLKHENRDLKKESEYRTKTVKDLEWRNADLQLQLRNYQLDGIEKDCIGRVVPSQHLHYKMKQVILKSNVVQNIPIHSLVWIRSTKVGEKIIAKVLMMQIDTDCGMYMVVECIGTLFVKNGHGQEKDIFSKKLDTLPCTTADCLPLGTEESFYIQRMLRGEDAKD